MNIALLLAAGSGIRMGQDIPKQFLHVCDKPVIIYTLEAFERHPAIDAIAVVCLEGYQEVLHAYCKQFCIDKLCCIVPGGSTGQESIKAGIDELARTFADDDIVLVHDAIRPLVSADSISDNIRVCTLYGNAVTCIPCAEAVLVSTDNLTSCEGLDRDTIKRTQTPQSLSLGSFLALHAQAAERGITNTVATCSLLIALGQTVHFSIGSEKNIKLTTLDDIDMFKALLQSKRSEWLK